MKIGMHSSLLSKYLQFIAFYEKKQVDYEPRNIHSSFSFSTNLY